MSKENINLPKTAFSMKANLQNKEPEILEYWKKIDLYKELRNPTRVRRSLYFMTAHHMRMEIFIWVRP